MASGLSTFVERQFEGADYKLSFYNLHTNENLEINYRDSDFYRPAALSKVNNFMRDYRTGNVRQIDARLLDVLFGLKRALQARHPGLDVRFTVISGYRSHGTNELLRAAGGSQAKHSQHIEGKAIDLRVSGVDLRELRNTAWCLHAGGVGYYASDNFIHVDTSRIRYWNWNPRSEHVRCGDEYALNE
jgi:uncharacterized protein YcbK (DUF882 family)